MADHGSSEDSLNWADRHIEHKELHTVIAEAVAGFTHHYAYGVSKCTFLTGMTGRPIHNLEVLECPPLVPFKRTLVYIAMSRYSQILLRYRNRAFPLRLVNALSAEESVCPMSCRYDTSFCRICCRSLKSPIEHVPHYSAAAMVTSRQPTINRMCALEQLLLYTSSEICPYCPARTAFDPQRVLQRRLFFK